MLTWAQARVQTQAMIKDQQKEDCSGCCPNAMDAAAEDLAELVMENPSSDLDDSIFRTPAVRPTLTRR